MSLDFSGGGLFERDNLHIIPKRKINYLSIPSVAFTGDNPDLDDIQHVDTGLVTTGVVTRLYTHLIVPHDAHLVSWIIYGDANLAGLQTRFTRTSLISAAALPKSP